MKPRLLKQIAALPGMSLNDLREKWRELFGTPPPGYSKAMMVRRLAYRIQELAQGGLSDSAQEHLRNVLEANGFNAKGRFATGVYKRWRRRKRKGMPVIGTRLVREWNGDRYEVTVVHGGYEFNGRRYRSLTAIAKEITGTKRSGPVFFGLRGQDENG